MTVRCLVVDDEPLGRERVAMLLRSVAGAEIVGTCSDGAEAVDAICELTPDVVYLDVQMPELDGFGVLAAIPQSNRPEVIFVTAHDKYALKAFEVHAQDYLLKPFDVDRFMAAFNRAAARIAERKSDHGPVRLQALIDEMLRQRSFRMRIPIKTDGRIVLLPVEHIDWIESDDNNVRVHVGDVMYVVRQTLQHMELSLSPAQFVRVHRSSIVNIARIKEIQPWFHGEYVVLLQGGQQVKTSRGYRARLEQLIG